MRCRPRPAALAACFLLLAAPAARLFAQEPPPEPRALYRQGLDAQLEDDPERAVELYRGALSLNPDYLEPRIGLAEVFFGLEEYEEALAYVQQARRYDARSTDLQILEGRISIGLGRWEPARNLLDGILAREPNNLEARFALAQLDLVTGKRQTAASRYLEALRVNPESRTALLSLVLLREEEGSLVEAARYLELALRGNAGDPEVHRVAGGFQERRGRLDLAERHLQTAIQLKRGSFPDAERALAGVFLGQGRVPEAQARLKERIGRDRRDAMAWYLQGLAAEAAGDLAGAAAGLAEAVRLRPEDELARIALEEMALRRLPLDSPVRRKAAGEHLRQGRLLESHNYLDKAQFEYRRCLQLDPESREGGLAFARLLKVQGHPVKYLRYLQRLKAQGTADTAVLDAIEITASETADGAAADWGVDQYALEVQPFRLALYTLPSRDQVLHRDAGPHLVRYLTRILERNERLQVLEEPPAAQGFDEAFRRAREKGADWFLLLQVEESERSFSARLELYLARTGTLLQEIQVFRTGNDRIRDALLRVASRFESLLPVRGRLLERRFDQGLVDIGRASGIRDGEKLLVVRKDRVQLANDRIGLRWRDEDLLGELAVARVDENLCEGRLESRSFFDRINPSDEVVRSTPAAEKAPEAEAGAGQGLLRRMFHLIGLDAPRPGR